MAAKVAARGSLQRVENDGAARGAGKRTREAVTDRGGQGVADPAPQTVAGGDKTHEAALKAMKGRWKNPIGGMGWYMRTKKDFAALPEE